MPDGRRIRPRRVLVRLGAALALLTAVALPAPANAQTVFEIYCTPTVAGLEELSGLSVGTDGTIFAIGDSGTDEQLAVLDPECALQRWLPNPVDPLDTEDLAVHGGSLWLADIGDNSRRRPTVALVRMNPVDGAGELHRLSYPDGAHDAETLLVGADGKPVLVTKEFSGANRIYASDTPVTALPTPGPAPLAQRGDIELGDGPDAALITGGAVTDDGKVVALRTYSHVYLFDAPDGDIVAALTRTPVEVQLPAQPQGEAIAFLPSGDLLVASEVGGAGTGALPPMHVLRGAAGLVSPSAGSVAVQFEWVQLAAVAAGVLMLTVGTWWLLRRRRLPAR